MSNLALRVLVVALLWQVRGIRGWPSTSSYANSSSTSSTSSTSSATSATITTPPIYCGKCELIYEVHAHNWWPSVYPAYVASVIYTVDNGTGSTINSSIQYIPNPTPEIGNINFTTLISSDIPGTKNVSGTIITTFSPLVGGVEYTTLSGSAADRVTITQVNGITFNATDYRNGYIYSTQFINSSLSGTAMTQCKGTYYVPLPNVTTPGMPAMTYYTYTTVVEANKSWLWTTALPYGLDILASEVATYLGLGISNCTSAGGGVGTLKIGVTTLTDYNTVYTSAPPAQSQVSTPPTTPTPSPSPSPSPPIVPPTSPPANTPATTPPPQQPPTQTPKTQIQGTTPPNSAPPASNPPPSSPPGQNPGSPNAPSSGSYTTTVVSIYTSAGSVGTTSYTTTLPVGSVVGASTPESYTTTVVGTFTSNGVVETTSFTTTAPVGSIIASLFSGGSATTTSTPAQFSGGAVGRSSGGIPWAMAVGLGAVLVV